MKWQLLRVMLALVLFATFAPTRVIPQAVDLDGLRKEHLIHDGVQRSWMVFDPEGERPTAGRTLVIGLHGGTGNGRRAAAMMNFHGVRLHEPVVVVYPDGIDGAWNDGRGVAFRRHITDGQDDVGFLRALIGTMIESRGIDPDRVFVAGISNGAMMAARLACEAPEVVAGVAMVVGLMPTAIASSCRDDVAVRWIGILGDADPAMPFEGGTIRALGRSLGEVLSAGDTFEQAARRNRCGGPASSTRSDALASEGLGLRIETYANCMAETRMIVIEGGGHGWPGSGIGRRAEWMFGHNAQRVRATELILDFFRTGRAGLP